MELWLHFGDNFTKASTKHVQFDLLVRGEEIQVLEGLRELTLRRDQACMGECYKLPGATMEEQAQWFLKYLVLLRQFVASFRRWEAQLAADRSGFIWSSPLSSLAADARLALRSVHAEEIMALFMYAALLQQQAYELACECLAPSCSGGGGEGGASLESSLSGLSLASSTDSAGSRLQQRPFPARTASALEASAAVGAPTGAAAGAAAAGGGAAGGAGPSFHRSISTPAACRPSSGGMNRSLTTPLGSRPAPAGEAGGAWTGEAAGHAAVASLYRKAAGVFQFVGTKLYPTATEAPGFAAGERPVELWKGAAEAMQTLCLAQAQGVAAHRAEVRGTPAALVAALHRGAAEMYERASATLRSIKPPPASSFTSASVTPSERLKRFLAISATLHEAKALRALAASCRAGLELGQASACLRDALAKVRQCMVVCERDADWRAALEPELHRLLDLHKAYEREREDVYCQRVPAAAPPLPDAKPIVSPAAFEPPNYGEAYFLE